MNRRTISIVEFAVLSARPEFHNQLAVLVRAVREEGAVARAELYECGLQAYLFAGFPAAFEAIRLLNRLWPAESEIAIEEEKLRRELSEYGHYQKRGDALYHRVYASSAGIVRRELLKLSPELSAWAVTEGYGKTLSRPGLEIETRELAVVAMLTQLSWERQLFSHIRGARNVGADLGDIERAILIGAREDAVKLTLAIGLLKRLR